MCSEFLSLSIKARPGEQLTIFSYKIKLNLHVNENSFSYERMGTKTRLRRRLWVIWNWPIHAYMELFWLVWVSKVRCIFFDFALPLTPHYMYQLAWKTCVTLWSNQKLNQTNHNLVSLVFLRFPSITCISFEFFIGSQDCRTVSSVIGQTDCYGFWFLVSRHSLKTSSCSQSTLDIDRNNDGMVNKPFNHCANEDFRIHKHCTHLKHSINKSWMINSMFQNLYAYGSLRTVRSLI